MIKPTAVALTGSRQPKALTLEGEPHGPEQLQPSRTSQSSAVEGSSFIAADLAVAQFAASIVSSNHAGQASIKARVPSMASSIAAAAAAPSVARALQALPSNVKEPVSSRNGGTELTGSAVPSENIWSPSSNVKASNRVPLSVSEEDLASTTQPSKAFQTAAGGMGTAQTAAVVPVFMGAAGPSATANVAVKQSSTSPQQQSRNSGTPQARSVMTAAHAGPASQAIGSGSPFPAPDTSRSTATPASAASLKPSYVVPSCSSSQPLILHSVDELSAADASSGKHLTVLASINQ